LEETGSSVRIYWPRELARRVDEISERAQNFQVFNPHAKVADLLSAMKAQSKP